MKKLIPDKYNHSIYIMQHKCINLGINRMLNFSQRRLSQYETLSIIGFVVWEKHFTGNYAVRKIQLKL